MKYIHFVCIAVFLMYGLLGAGMEVAACQDKPREAEELEKKIEALRKQMEAIKEGNDARIRSLEQEIERLKVKEKQAGEEEDIEALLGDPAGDQDELDALLGDMAGGAESGLAAQEPSFTRSIGRAFQSMNPEISVIGDFLFHSTSNEDGDLDDEFRFRELELGFSAAVDPYARADFFIGIGQHRDGDWETELEEGYVTFLTIPWDLQPRVGRFRATLGKVNTMHLHAIPWVDYPLVIQNYFGHHGLSGDGAGVSWLVPNPWDKFIEFTYEITNNDNDLFAGTESDDFMHVLHLKNFFDVSDASTLELGLSMATGPNDERHGSDRSNVGGLDVTYRWRPPQAGLYRSFLWQTEFMTARVDQVVGHENSFGMYSGIDYQFARRWVAGTRYDYSELPYQSGLHENAYSASMTFIQSEFLFWRLTYRYTDLNFDVLGEDYEHEVFLQCNFGIGPHRAHKY